MAPTIATTSSAAPLLAYSTEAIEQFQLATSQFNAADGRTGGAALTMVTKSGTNVFHGSAFVFGRSDKMTAKDFFTAEADRDKTPFSRQAFGGSVGGPIMRNRAFFFGAVERHPGGLGACRPGEPVHRKTAARGRPGAGADSAGICQSQQPDVGGPAVASAADHRQGERAVDEPARGDDPVRRP